MDAATEPVADPAADRRIGKILRRHRLRRRTVGRAIGRGPGAVLSAGVVGALVLSGCASQDPGVPEPAAQTQPITVGADLADAQQAVLGEVYVGAMERRGRGAEAVIDVPSEERMQAVQSGGVTLSFGCTGELLGLIDPVTARELADEYIADDDPHLQRGDLRFEPMLALSSGADGMDAIRHITTRAAAHLHDGAWLLLEHGWEQGEAVRELLAAAGFDAVQTHRDLEHRDRVTSGRWPR